MNIQRAWFSFILLTLGTLFLLAGCGSSGPGTAHVHGKVLLNNGKPLTGGTLAFFPVEGGRDRLPVSVAIGPDGAYDAPAVPVGQVKISVNNATLDPRAGRPAFMLAGKGANMPGMPSPDKIGPPKGALKGTETFLPAVVRPKGKYVPIDSKYADAEKSGLTYEVQPGDQVHNIEGIAIVRRTP